MFDTMKSIHQLLEIYGESHRNKINKTIHWICVPSIMFSIIGLIMAIPFPFSSQKTIFLNWGFIFLVLSWIYYLRLSFNMFLGFLLIGSFMMWGNFLILNASESDQNLSIVSATIFVIAWIGQFIGHKIEGKKPSFLQDLQFLLIGPAWLLHFIFNKFGVRF